MADNLSMGSVYSWGHIHCNMFGDQLVGFEGIEWKKTQKKDHIYGVGRNPVGVGRGNNEYTGSIDILYDELIKIIKVAPGGSITDIPPFSIFVDFDATTTEPPRRVKLIKVEFTESPFRSSQNDTSIKVTLPILIGDIVYI